MLFLSNANFIPNRLHVITHCCHFKTHHICLHANHAHHILPLPMTGTIRRYDTRGVIIDKL